MQKPVAIHGKNVNTLRASVYIHAIAQWFEVCLVLCCVVDSNPYQLSCPGSSVGRALA